MSASRSKPVRSSRSTREIRSASVCVVATAGASAAMISSSSVAGTLRGGLVARRRDRHPHGEGRDEVRAAARPDHDRQARAAVRPDPAEDAARQPEALRGGLVAPPDAERPLAELLVAARELDAALAAGEQR